MEELIRRAFEAQTQAKHHSITVAPEVPILYFGDLAAYKASTLRILTVAINPSSAEFPESDPLQRFPAWRQSPPSTLSAEPTQYLKGLNDYFHAVPYTKWFGHLRAPLEGFDAAFDGSHRNVALHTDFASPVVTNPIWSKIPDNGTREALLATGSQLWHALVATLQPHLVLLSYARPRLKLIRFRSQVDWANVHTMPFGNEVVQVLHRIYGLNTDPSDSRAWQADFLFCPPHRQPFGGITYAHLRDMGPALRHQLTHW